MKSGHCSVGDRPWRETAQDQSGEVWLRLWRLRGIGCSQIQEESLMAQEQGKISSDLSFRKTTDSSTDRGRGAGGGLALKELSEELEIVILHPHWKPPWKNAHLTLKVDLTRVPTCVWGTASNASLSAYPRPAFVSLLVWCCFLGINSLSVNSLKCFLVTALLRERKKLAVLVFHSDDCLRPTESPPLCRKDWVQPPA